MSSLFGTLSVALSGLLAEQGALEVTTNNVANANTPGYSRQRPVMVEGNPVVEDPLTFGTGVVLDRIESIRDPILELRINQETQQRNKLDTTVTALQQREVMFSGGSGDLGTQISNLFNALNQLSTNPTSGSQRQAVLTAAANMATAFHNTARTLSGQKTNLDLSVGQMVDQINLLTGQIARLNDQIAGMQNLNEDAGTFIDQRTELVRQLSELIDVSSVQSDKGLTLTTSKGIALVAQDRSFALSTQLDASGVQHVYSGSSDITSQVTGGKIAGLISVRDQKIPGLLSDLDTLAAGLASALNQANRSGFDLKRLRRQQSRKAYRSRRADFHFREAFLLQVLQ